MNTKYDYIFFQCADLYEKTSPNAIAAMFEMALSMGCKLNSFKKWIMMQPISDYTKGRIESIYNDFVEGA